MAHQSCLMRRTELSIAMQKAAPSPSNSPTKPLHDIKSLPLYIIKSNTQYNINSITNPKKLYAYEIQFESQPRKRGIPDWQDHHGNRGRWICQQSRTMMIKIEQCDDEWNVIRVWNSSKELAEHFGVKPAYIRKAIYRKHRLRGFRLRYNKEDYEKKRTNP